MLITADECLRGGRNDSAQSQRRRRAATSAGVEDVDRRQAHRRAVNMKAGRDVYHDEVAKRPPIARAEKMNAEDPLFILYTSGSTGKPKGVVHTTAGYLVWTAITHKYVFDIHDGDIYWCTADIGWVTGHSYIVYGPLSNGGTR